MSYQANDFALMQTVRERLDRLVDYYYHSEDGRNFIPPDYTLWQVLTRYDQALGKKDRRYVVMAWMFPGKWGIGKKVSGKDLSAIEVHIMAKWSDPNRMEQFEEEVNAVYNICTAEIDLPKTKEFCLEALEDSHE